ncbi:MAG: tetratricopeptide repeat protein [Marinilabiliaceae bacterium]|nr:tetratricopeptide repeat protein [Marinilabiliaceae bacterium]
MLTIGRNALYFEDYVLAIQYFNKVIRVKPYLADPYFYRGLAKYYLEDYTGAQTDLSVSIQKNPFMVDAYNLRGIIKGRNEDHEEAIDDYSMGLAIEPENINLLMNRGNSKSALKDFQSAIDDYNKIIQSDPALLSAYLNRGAAKINNRDTIGALNDFSKVVEMNPFIVDGFASRGILYYQIGEYAKALEDYEKVIEIKDDVSGYYMTRGVIRYQLDDLRGTMSDFDKVIELDPKNSMAYNNRGILRAQIGDLNRALEDFSRVLALDPTDLLTLFNRGLIYNELGQYHNALADLNIIIDNYPKFHSAYGARGFAKSKLNDQQGANIDYQTAWKLEQDSRKKAEKEVPHGDVASKEETDKEKSSKKKKQTRKKSDKDIRNYDKIAVLDDFGEEEAEEDEFQSIRGKVQNRNIFIDLEPVFGLSFFSADTMLDRTRYYQKEIAAFNKLQLYNQSLVITNRESEADGLNSVRFFRQISGITEEMKDQEAEKEYQVVRAVLYGLVMNYSNAIQDYDAFLKKQPDNVVALFNRAYIRHKMVEVIRSLEEESTPGEVNLTSGLNTRVSGVKGDDKEKGIEHILDYELIIADLNKVIELSPDFEFAYYNRAIIHCLKRDFESGELDFTKAIELNADFAEAYFNRGLIKIYKEQEKEGTADLSKAGELGIYKAYNVIKRYGAELSEE